jgi:hypothetical protein
MIETHSWITAFVYPVVSGIASSLYIATYLRNKRVQALCFLGVGALLSCAISTLWLVLRLQKAFGIDYISASNARVLWWVQAAAEYVSIAFYITGVILLCRHFWQRIIAANGQDQGSKRHKCSK